MDLENCIRIMQDYLSDSPLIVLGSGASVPYGLPSMNDLADKVRDNDVVKKDANYEKFCHLLSSSGLENAIDGSLLSDESLTNIRIIIWNEIQQYELAYFEKNNYNPPKALVELLEKVIEPSFNKAVVVTTNYDRLSDFAIDFINATCVNGFNGNYLKKYEFPSSAARRERAKTRERVVDIWKVHGSIDWFVNDDGDIFSLPFIQKIPKGFAPLIVPPGREKYNKTHNEPYRGIISEADKAFSNAGSYLCVGYGFNDDHIQPKLLSQINNNKPIVVLTYKMTDACRKNIIDKNIKKYLIFEYYDDTKSIIYGNGWSAKVDGQYWQLDKFLNIW